MDYGILSGWRWWSHLGQSLNSSVSLFGPFLAEEAQFLSEPLLCQVFSVPDLKHLRESRYRKIKTDYSHQIPVCKVSCVS